MLPPKSWESAEIGVGRSHGATVLDCNRRVLGVSHQLPCRSGLTAQPFKYVQVIGTWTDDARSRAFNERGDECERSVKSGWRGKDSRISYHADEAGQNKDGQSEGFRPCRQTSDPRRILGVLGNDVLDVGIYQNIYVRKQHPESPAAVPEPGLVIQFVERPRSVEIDAGAGVNAPHGHQPEGRLLRRFAALQSVVQCLGDKGADADAAGFGCAAHLPRKLVVKGDSGSHDAVA